MNVQSSDILKQYLTKTKLTKGMDNLEIHAA